jgi:predicted Zn-dependent peptidase
MTARVRVALPIALLVAGLATFGMPSRAAVPVAGGPTRYRLANGLTVIVSENRSSDLVVAQALIRAGTRLEDPAQSGITFFVRGMLVRGTQRRTATEIAQTIEGVGGLMGGGTGADFTSIYTITPSRHLDVGLDLLADLLSDARFDPQDIETQRRISLSRISQNEDQPLQHAIDLFNATLYPYHPYAHSVLGTRETVSSLTREHLVAFYRSFFTAPNTVLVVAGNIATNQALEKVERAFGRLRTEPSPRRHGWLRAVERALAPPLPAPREVRESRAIAAAWIALGYLGVPVGHQDFPALRVLSALLGEGMSSRLFVQIRERAGLAYQVGSVLPVRAGPSHLRIIAGTDPPNLSTVVAAMLREVERLRAEAPPAEDVAQAKRSIIGRYALAREDLEQRAFYLGWYEVLGVGFEYDARFAEEIGRVTPEDLLRVARRYLTSHVLAVVAPPTAR